MRKEFAKDDNIHRSIDWNSRRSSFEEEETDVGSQGSNSRRSRSNNRSDTVLSRSPNRPIKDQVLTAIDHPVDRPNTEGYRITNGQPT